VTRPDAPAFQPAPSSPARIAAAAGIALLVAGFVLVVAVLPAEYGIDPLGTGRALGLTALSATAPERVTAQPGTFKTDSAEFILGRYQSVEYTYRIEEGAGVLFSWRATGTVRSDFHGQPDGAPADYAESHDRREGTVAHGTFVAPFPGTHGWYWENLTDGEVTITVQTAGFYSRAQEFFDGRVLDHPLRDPQGRSEGTAP
jgi:hypothetical protein